MKFARFFCGMLCLFLATGLGAKHTCLFELNNLGYKTSLFPFNAVGEDKLAVQDVLFATNEDVDLYINNELKGVLSKKAHLILQLPAGNHTYKAKSKTSPYELHQTITIKDGGLNEFFIDFLYFLDEKKLVEESLKNNTAKPGTKPTTTTASLDSASQQKAADISKEAERIVLNSLVSNMVRVKGGQYTMGNNKASATDELEHPVIISDIQFSKFEVTQQQWAVIMGNNPSKNAGCATCPVENVSWEEVMRFIRKINVASNKKFRLPTEAEWEYVAKLGGKEEVDKAGGQEEYIKKTAWYFANSSKTTHPVGQKQPNAAGIYDMMGNVSEWCSDWYGSYYYKEDDNQKDPEGPPLGKEKVVRGGSFLDYNGDQFRPSYRAKKLPTSKSENIGFRLVLEVN